MARLEGKVCIVTGASSGIGKGTAELFAREGARVVVADIQEERGREVAAAIAAEGGTASFFRLDVTDENAWRAVVDFATATYGHLDVLVNNAGINVMNHIVSTPLDEFRRVMAVNMESVFLGTKHVAPAMRKSGGGSIINISSNMVMAPMANNGAYVASKGAVAYFTRVAAIELARDRIRVNTVYPGFVETPILDQVFEAAAQVGKSREAVLEKIADSNLLHHVGQPIELALPLVFLASDEARYVTGADFVVDGGEVWKRADLSTEMDKAGDPPEWEGEHVSGPEWETAEPSVDEPAWETAEPPVDEAERWERFVGSRTWTFARTYALTYPHEYTKAEAGTDTEFMWAVDYIRRVGTVQTFWGYKGTYLYQGAHKYWTMGSPVDETTILNRCFPDPLDHEPQMPGGRMTGRQAEVVAELGRLSRQLHSDRRRQVEAICAAYLEGKTNELTTRTLFPDS